MAAEKLLQQVLDAHGGIDLWSRAKQLKISVSCGGAALALRFQAGAYRSYDAVIKTTEVHVSFTPFKGHTGVFTPERVWIEDDQKNILKERQHPRNAFPSIRRHFVWDDLDVLYFGGYAMWNYLCAPFFFTLPGFEFNERLTWKHAGETWRPLEVRFPESFHTHCPVQTFHINDRGYVRRQDYTAEVIGNYAVAGHYCDTHQTVDGLVFPMKRRVYPRRADNSCLPFPTLIWIDIHQIEIIYDDNEK